MSIWFAKKMKTFLSFLLFGFMAAGTSAGEMRTWRDQKTVSALEAELVGVKDGNIILRLDNGRKYTLPISRFHSDDKAYVAKWVKARKPAPKKPVAKKKKPSKKKASAKKKSAPRKKPAKGKP